MIKLGQGTAGKIEDSETLEVAKKWIDSQSDPKRIFLAMNLQNTHFSYVIPPGGVEPYQPGELDFPAIYYYWDEAHVEKVRNRYLNAVHNLDRLQPVEPSAIRPVKLFSKPLTPVGLFPE